jgi:type I restriction enzyme, S subunit
VPVLSLGAVTGFTYRPTEYKRTSEITDPDGPYWLRPGDLLMTRSNTEQLLGHAAIYSGAVAVHLPRPHDAAQGRSWSSGARFVYYWLRTPDVRARIQRAGSGTSSTMKKITQNDVIRLAFPADTGLAEQRATVDKLDEIA